MDKYNDVKYDKYRELIMYYINENMGDDHVYYAGKGTEEGLDNSLEVFHTFIEYKITKKEWFQLCRIEIEQHENTLLVNPLDGVIFSLGENNDYRIPTNKSDPWNVFKKISLKKNNGFNDETISKIEDDVLNITNSLNLEMDSYKAIKGLVVGGVQSGKTTNIASLMIMAANLGFNMFIILSGMVENLREQTENRIADLIKPTDGKGYNWKRIGNSKNERITRLDRIYDDKFCFYTVVLKNKTRLEDLIFWLSSDQYTSKKLKILVIDDEADQASANTSENPNEERKTINRLIVNLVHSRNKKGINLPSPYKVVNYIGYTATPYANILSESPDNPDSLYPTDFISVLNKSNRHMGPLEIFGDLSKDNDGIDQVRIIEDENEIKNITSKNKNQLPESLKDSISYFIGSAASLRKHNFQKPVSMLVHVSHLQKYHKLIREKIEKWLINNKEDILDRIQYIWNRELESINISDLRRKIYIDESKILKKHNFEEIEEEIKEILDIIEPIGKGKEVGLLKYHEGIHIQVDNSDETYDTTSHIHKMVYPEKSKHNRKTPIFLVIGGDTLSRGLTLEGLITSYFLRTPSAADTLTQMGRWFGYRINYELYPRIWMTRKTYRQFQYISTLENELREEIEQMNYLGLSPKEVGPKIKTMPQYISVTSRAKSRAMVPVEFDFSGYSAQTYIFDDNLELQNTNLFIGESFINYLGKPKIVSTSQKDNVYWENISFDVIKEKLLIKYKFNSRIKNFSNFDNFIKWIEKATKEGNLTNWNVILGGLGKANEKNNNWKLDYISYNMVTRTKKSDSINGEINVGVISNPSDLFADIDINVLKKEEDKKMIDNAIKSGLRNAYSRVRFELGMSKIPQLILYKIDKNSKPKNSKNREGLGIETDLFGIYISMPGLGRKSNVTHITVDIKDIPDNGLDEVDNE